MKVYNYLNLKKSVKNIIIFFPLILSGLRPSEDIIIKLFLGFLVFFCTTNIIYITNDYIDRFRDQFNNLKKETLNYSKKTILFLNFILIFSIFIFFNTEMVNKFLIFYIINFYIYVFFLKKFKYFDIISLLLFYLFRIGYGSELSQINMSYGFLIFFISLFLFLANCKRIVQIQKNKIKDLYKIISYRKSDLKKIYLINLIFISINILLIFLYFFNNYISININLFGSGIEFKLYEKVIIFMVYSLNILRINNLIKKGKIKRDIFNFVLDDKLILFSSFFMILIFYI